MAYELQNNAPVLVEYRASDGANLGSTELPFTPATLEVGLFEVPQEPRLLLADADSLVVYKINTPCSVPKGDMNGDGNLTMFDIVLELNCVFLGSGSCHLCFADVNCDGVLTASDVVLELNAVFLQNPLPCS